MGKNENLRLSGGIFFLLILEARKPLQSRKNYWNGEVEPLSEVDTLFGLAKIGVPDLQPIRASMKGTAKVNTSNFKSCKGNGGDLFRFGEKAARRSFDALVRTDYRAALIRMSEFVNKYLDIRGSMEKDERLIRALVDLIGQDKSIPEEQVFFVMENGVPVTKRVMLTQKKFCFDSFLLGIWHYALLRDEGNEIGQDTFDKLCPPNNSRRREYEGELGETILFISLTYFDKEAAFIDNPYEAEAETIYEKIENQIPLPNQEDPFCQSLQAASQTIFIQQNGNYNTVIPNYGTLNLMIGGKDSHD